MKSLIYSPAEDKDRHTAGFVVIHNLTLKFLEYVNYKIFNILEKYL